jgi:hypothetical protein
MRMQRGDFFSHFMDTAYADLSMLVSDIEPSRVTALLETALHVSSASTDPFKDSLKFRLAPQVGVVHGGPPLPTPVCLCVCVCVCVCGLVWVGGWVGGWWWWWGGRGGGRSL